MKMNLRRTIAKVNNFATRLRHTRIYDQRIGYQLHECTVLRRIIDEFSVDCIFDIGANQGQYAQMLRSYIGFKGTIISVDPNPKTFCVLKNRAKSDAEWRAENIALAGHDREQYRSKMAEHQVTSLSERVATKISNVSTLNSARRNSVPVKTLKTFYLEARNASHFARPFLRMDAQGYDSIIAQSAGELIGQFVGIQTNLSFIDLCSDLIPFHDSLDLYAKLGFALCAIVPNNSGHFPYLQDAIFINTDFLGSRLGTR